MKNYISKATLALLVALSATGCSDFLDEKLKSELAPDNTYTSSYGFEVGSTGLYAEARSEYNTWGENGAFMHNAACPYEALQIATDLATMALKTVLSNRSVFDINSKYRYCGFLLELGL